MKQLFDLSLFSLLKEADGEELNESKMEIAYDEFARKLLEKSQLEMDKASLYYHLGFIRLELVGVRSILSDEKGKKCFMCNK